MRFHRRHLLALILALLGCAASPTGRYLSMLDRDIRATRASVPYMTRSAGAAADRLLAGGRLWVAGSEDFQIEAFIRAGGVMSLKRLGDNMPGSKDVVLYSDPFDADAPQLANWTEAGKLLVYFMDAQGRSANLTSVMDADGLGLATERCARRIPCTTSCIFGRGRANWPQP